MYLPCENLKECEGGLDDQVKYCGGENEGKKTAQVVPATSFGGRLCVSPPQTVLLTISPKKDVG